MIYMYLLHFVYHKYIRNYVGCMQRSCAFVMFFYSCIVYISYVLGW